MNERSTVRDFKSTPNRRETVSPTTLQGLLLGLDDDQSEKSDASLRLNNSTISSNISTFLANEDVSLLSEVSPLAGENIRN